MGEARASAHDSNAGFGTRCVHGGTEPEPVTGAIMTPIFQTSTYVQPYPAEHKGYEYSRTQNPTREALEACLAGLEGGRHAIAFASGMAAIDTVMKLCAAGDHVVAGNDLYGGTYRLFTSVYEAFGIRFSFVDTHDLDAVRAACANQTRILWIETPSNPLLRISDLAELAEIGRAANAITVCDNTFATPCLQRPLEHGFDLCLHSTTKYIGGHSDTVGGSVVTGDEAHGTRLRFLQNAAGAVPGPFDCFLTLRGAKTLHVRVARHCRNAERIASFLHEHARVRLVHYPGLAHHPNHNVARRQMSGFGGMVAFELDGTVEDGKALCTRTKLFQCAESLGGVESLIEHPASMTHAAIPAEVRRAAGFADGLIRLSVGVEDAQDLVADLEQALADTDAAGD